MSQLTSLLEPTLHNTSKGIKNGLGCKVFGGNEVDEMLLPSFLLQVQSVSVPTSISQG
jgi:hypothetical protein